MSKLPDPQSHLEDHDHDGSPTQQLLQANTHESPDTDSSAAALHHTLGTDPDQAAAGDHTHDGGGGGLTQAFVGYNTVGGTMENANSYTVYAKKITLANDCLLTSIDTYMDWGNGNDSVSSWGAAVYADDSGTPSAVIGAAPPAGTTLLLDSVNGAGGNTTGRWLSIPIGKWLTAGDYWIAVHTGGAGNCARIARDDIGSGSHDRTYNPGGAWFSDWGWYSPTTTTKEYSIRANTVR